jgi:hypothetical protein
VRLHSLLRYAARMKRRAPSTDASFPMRVVPGMQSARFYTLVPQELWSQDFLLVAQPDDLLKAHSIQW